MILGKTFNNYLFKSPNAYFSDGCGDHMSLGLPGAKAVSPVLLKMSNFELTLPVRITYYLPFTNWAILLGGSEENKCSMEWIGCLIAWARSYSIK